MPFRPLKTGRDTICCIHWRTWPPLKAFEFEGQAGADLYRAGDLTAVELQRFQIWERDCGLLVIREDKCRTCPHVRRVEILPPEVPTLVTMDGKTKTPIMDKTFVAALAQFRSTLMATQRSDGDPLSRRNAAWVRQARAQGDGDE